MQQTKSFISFGHATSGLVFNEESHPKFPLRYYNLIDGDGITPDENCSYFVIVYDGNASLIIENGINGVLPKGSYFSIHGEFLLVGQFKAICIEVICGAGKFNESKFTAATVIGGPIEAEGRLKYIDGCTDSLLIPPVKKGDPCLNHLHFPKSIIQTAHTHPSHRIGIVAGGSGECVTPFGNLPLVEGCIFVIKEYDGQEKSLGLDGELHDAGTHKFDTFGSHMDVIAFHPDSDFGPEDECHPMINRTIVNGVSANQIDSIKTQ